MVSAWSYRWYQIFVEQHVHFITSCPTLALQAPALWLISYMCHIFIELVNVLPSFAGALTTSDLLGLRVNDHGKPVGVRCLPHGVVTVGPHIYLGGPSHNKRHIVYIPM